MPDEPFALIRAAFAAWRRPLRDRHHHGHDFDPGHAHGPGLFGDRLFLQRRKTCHAGAITIAGDTGKCGTFVEISFRGGLDRNGVVGACHRSECKFNDKLECTASSVEIGAGTDVADCLTYEAR